MVLFSKYLSFNGMGGMEWYGWIGMKLWLLMISHRVAFALFTGLRHYSSYVFLKLKILSIFVLFCDVLMLRMMDIEVCGHRILSSWN